eukprot:COSAG02_NODE_36480_length_454_cov_0.678873_1_plen_62_part_01
MVVRAGAVLLLVVVLVLLADGTTVRMDRIDASKEVSVWSAAHRTPFGLRPAGCTLEVQQHRT